MFTNRVDLNTLFFGLSHAMDPKSLSKHVEKKELANEKEVSLNFHLDNIPWCVIACTPCTIHKLFSNDVKKGKLNIYYKLKWVMLNPHFEIHLVLCSLNVTLHEYLEKVVEEFVIMS